MKAIEEKIRRIILNRSVAYTDMPTGFPDREEYIVDVRLINNLIWVTLNRDLLSIDAFEVRINNGAICVIDHPLDYSTISLHIYSRKTLWKFKMQKQEFELFEKRKQRKAKLMKLFG